MAIGTCKFWRQIGGRGCYAFVRLDVETSDMPAEIDISAIGDQQRFLIPAVQTGIDLALDLTRQQWVDVATNTSPTKLSFHRVKVLEVKYAPADSSEIMFVYAAAMAFADALNIHLDIPIKVDRETNARYFCFPF